MTNRTKDCNAIAEAYATKVADGLLDVKFLLKNKTEITNAEACAGFAMVQAAIDGGNAKPLDFGDLNWQ